MAVVCRSIPEVGADQGLHRITVGCRALCWAVSSLRLELVGRLAFFCRSNTDFNPFSDVLELCADCFLRKKKVTEGCPQSSELRFISDRCFPKSRIVPEPLGRLAESEHQVKAQSLFDLVSGFCTITQLLPAIGCEQMTWCTLVLDHP